jgi:hypothetical protein
MLSSPPILKVEEAGSSLPRFRGAYECHLKMEVVLSSETQLTATGLTCVTSLTITVFTNCKFLLDFEDDTGPICSVYAKRWRYDSETFREVIQGAWR